MQFIFSNKYIMFKRGLDIFIGKQVKKKLIKKILHSVNVTSRHLYFHYSCDIVLNRMFHKNDKG